MSCFFILATFLSELAQVYDKGLKNYQAQAFFNLTATNILKSDEIMKIQL